MPITCLAGRIIPRVFNDFLKGIAELTKDELRKIFDDAEKNVLNSDTHQKILSELNNPKNNPPTDEASFTARVNMILEKEILLEVLSKVLADKKI